MANIAASQEIYFTHVYSAGGFFRKLRDFWVTFVFQNAFKICWGYFLICHVSVLSIGSLFNFQK